MKVFSEKTNREPKKHACTKTPRLSKHYSYIRLLSLSNKYTYKHTFSNPSINSFNLTYKTLDKTLNSYSSNGGHWQQHGKQCGSSHCRCSRLELFSRCSQICRFLLRIRILSLTPSLFIYIYKSL